MERRASTDVGDVWVFHVKHANVGRLGDEEDRWLGTTATARRVSTALTKALSAVSPVAPSCDMCEMTVRCRCEDVRVAS